MSAQLDGWRVAVPGEGAPNWSPVVLAVIGATGLAWSGWHIVAARLVVAVPVDSTHVDGGAAELAGPDREASKREVPDREATADPVPHREASSGVPSVAAVAPEPVGAASSTNPPPPAEAGAPEPSDCPPLFSIRFGRTSSDAIDLEAPAIAALVSWLRAHPDSSLVIQGHADAVGAARFNFALSHRRAQTVARRFADAGLPKRRMVVQAVGEFQPRVDGELADNRRVVLRATRADGCRGAFTPEDDR